MKSLSVIAIALTSVMSIRSSLANDSHYTIYLVRHADKVISDASDRDPELTACGRQRANQLAVMLSSIELKAIYSTDYKRTQATAAPIALQTKLEIKPYRPNELDSLVEQLQRLKQTALVVGHNSTTNVVAGGLAGLSLPIIDEKEYDRLYQVTMTPSGPMFQLLNQGFVCSVSDV